MLLLLLDEHAVSCFRQHDVQLILEKMACLSRIPENAR